MKNCASSGSNQWTCTFNVNLKLACSYWAHRKKLDMGLGTKPTKFRKISGMANVFYRKRNVLTLTNRFACNVWKMICSLSAICQNKCKISSCNNSAFVTRSTCSIMSTPLPRNVDAVIFVSVDWHDWRLRLRTFSNWFQPLPRRCQLLQWSYDPSRQRHLQMEIVTFCTVPIHWSKTLTMSK